MHDLSIIVTLAGALAVALVLGWITRSLGLSTLVGYMLAGVVVGPFTPGFVADTQLAKQMAEIGVILLMFSVGMHFHPQELLAVPGAIVQSLFAGAAGWAAARWLRTWIGGLGLP
jgi:CPA2 family monovalent cation:H+ antiporter-2